MKFNHALIFFLVLCPLLPLGRFATAVEIVSESEFNVCEEFHLPRDLKIYKDPSVFLGDFNLVFMDPSSSWEVLSVENPLLTTVRGDLHMMRLGPNREFRNFGAISSFYDFTKTQSGIARGTDSPTKEIIPIRLCGTRDAYSDSLGFILAEDLQEAQTAVNDENELPPSTPGNPIPKLKDSRSIAVKEPNGG